jgi:4-hydroxy-3-methylbut-2-enyl diphosphate reductase IspH
MDFLEFSEARCKKINDGASYLKKQQKNIITLDQGHPETWGTLGTTDSSPA